MRLPVYFIAKEVIWMQARAKKREAEVKDNTNYFDAEVKSIHAFHFAVPSFYGHFHSSNIKKTNSFFALTFFLARQTIAQMNSDLDSTPE